MFVADQNPGSTAKNTRQNPNGNRNGLECPEERDYHPYWHPSPWWDIATLAQDQSLCPYYQSESFNVKPKRELSALCSEVVGRRCSVEKQHSGKYLCQSLFFNKVVGLSLQLYEKRDLGTGVCFLRIL